MKSFFAGILIVVATSTVPAFADQPRPSEIPPNCTLDPWTGALNCHILPSCTLDPFTGKMHCRTPVAGLPVRVAR